MSTLGTEAVDRCPACGGSGRFVYHGLEDGHFGTPGAWAVRQCDRCASLWLDPRPDDAAIPATYGCYYTHGELADPPGGPRAKSLLRLLPWHHDDAPADTAHLGDGPGRALDLGCGDGRTALALQDAGWRVLGIDQDAASIDAARAAGLRDARVGTIVDIPAGAQFDAVVMSHVLEHLVAPVEILTQVRARLRPGGMLTVLTPNARSASHQRFGAAWRGLEVPRHLQVFSPVGLRGVLGQSGFTIRQLRTSARGANGVARAAAHPGGPPPGRLGRLTSYAEGEVWQSRVARRLRRDPWAGEELVVLAIA